MPKQQTAREAWEKVLTESSGWKIPWPARSKIPCLTTVYHHLSKVYKVLMHEIDHENKIKITNGF